MIKINFQNILIYILLTFHFINEAYRSYLETSNLNKIKTNQN
jgi:hypothetical protein